MAVAEAQRWWLHCGVGGWMDTSAPAYPATAYVLASDYDELRRRLAEVEADNERLRGALSEALENVVADTNRVEADFAEAVRCVASSLDNRGLITAEAACQNAASSLRVLANGIDQLRQRVAEVEAECKTRREDYATLTAMWQDDAERLETKLALAEQCEPHRATGCGQSWEGGGKTTITFDGAFDIQLLRDYRLVPVAAIDGSGDQNAQT